MRVFAIWVPLIVLATAWATSVAGDPQPKQLGPEWIKEGDKFTKTGETIKWSRYSSSSGSSGCALRLSNNVMYVSDRDNNYGFKAAVEGYGHWEVHKSDAGRKCDFAVRLKNFNYQDIDGDGMIDGMCEHRPNGSQLSILYEMRWVEVEYALDAWTATKEHKPRSWGIGRKELYEFDNGKWKMIPIPGVHQPVPAADGKFVPLKP